MNIKRSNSITSSEKREEAVFQGVYMGSLTTRSWVLFSSMVVSVCFPLFEGMAQSATAQLSPQSAPAYFDKNVRVTMMFKPGLASLPEKELRIAKPASLVRINKMDSSGRKYHVFIRVPQPRDLTEMSIRVGLNPSKFIHQPLTVWFKRAGASGSSTSTPLPTPKVTPYSATPIPIATPAPTKTSSGQQRVSATPAAPTQYALPSNAIRVTNSSDLIRALAAERATDIIVADGEYSTDSYFNNGCGHRVYAEHVGRALFRSGFAIGSSWCNASGALLRGLSFSVNSQSKTLLSSIVHVWGTGQNVKLLDLTLDGNRVIDDGVLVREPQGAVIQRVVARRFLSNGVKVDANKMDMTLSKPVILEDIDASDVSRSTPLSANGTAEACIWIGNTTLAKRLRMNNCSWMGLWTGTSASDSVISDVQIDNTKNVGIYFEHFTKNTIVERAQIGPTVKIGAICEWNDPDWGRRPGCSNVMIQDSTISSSCVGVYLDEGTEGTTVRKTTFKGQKWAAIAAYKGVNVLWDTQGIDTSGVAEGAQRITYDHYSAAGNKCW